MLEQKLCTDLILFCLVRDGIGWGGDLVPCGSIASCLPQRTLWPAVLGKVPLSCDAICSHCVSTTKYQCFQGLKHLSVVRLTLFSIL